MIDADGKNNKRITPYGEQVFGKSAWSPDGNTIAYIEMDTSFQWSRGRIKLIDPDGKNPRILTNWFLDITYLNWSNDSKVIYFDGAGSDGRDRIYKIGYDGSSLSPLFISDQGCYFPSLSPDGKLVAFSSFAVIDSNYFSKIYTFSLSSNQITQITINKTFDYSPTWSPDSKYIVYSSSPIGGLSSSLMKIKIDGTEVSSITDNTNIDIHPSWFK